MSAVSRVTNLLNNVKDSVSSLGHDDFDHKL